MYNALAVSGLSTPVAFFTGANSSSLFTLKILMLSAMLKASNIKASNLYAFGSVGSTKFPEASK